MAMAMRSWCMERGGRTGFGVCLRLRLRLRAAARPAERFPDLRFCSMVPGMADVGGDAGTAASLLRSEWQVEGRARGWLRS